MAGVRINAFGGLIPRDNPITRSPGVARVALDVNLDQNTIAPWREPKVVHEEQFDILGMFRPDCCWLTSEKCAEYTRLWPSCTYVVRTGVQSYPEISTFEEACEGVWCRLGVPCPTIAPTASPVNPQAVDQTTQLRSYRYTWLNKYDQEGNGSPPSLSYNVVDGGSVMLQIPPCDAGPEYCIEKVAIYRTGTPFESGGETSNPQNTEWFLVDVVDCGTSSYVDNKKNIDLSANGKYFATFTREETLPPPDDLHSIVDLENGMMAGISDDWVIMSEPFAPHSWPLKLKKKLFNKPRRLAAIKDTLYVATDGFPYTIQATQDCNTNGIQGVFRHREPLPIISTRGMVAGTSAVYYPTTDGLVALSGTSARVISEAVWSKEQWQKIRPNRLIGAILNNYYFGFTDIYGFRLRTVDTEHIDPAKNALTEISDRPQSLWVSTEGYLYMAIGGQIKEWNTGNRQRPYTWRSTEYVFGRRSPVAAAYAFIERKGQLNVKLITDKGSYSREIVNSDLFRVPNWMQVGELAFELTGTAEVKEIAAGTSYSETYRAGANV